MTELLTLMVLGQQQLLMLLSGLADNKTLLKDLEADPIHINLLITNCWITTDTEGQNLEAILDMVTEILSHQKETPILQMLLLS